MLYSESMAQQLNFPLCLQDWKSFIALKHTVVQVSSSLQWGNTHFLIGTTLDSLSQTISMLYELPGSLKHKSEEQAECSNPRSKSKARYPLGCLVLLLLFNLEATLCPPLAPRTGGVSKWCPLQMGTQLPTSSHIYPAKPASSTDKAGLHFPQSSLTLHIWQNIAYLAKKTLAWSIMQIPRLSKYERQYWEPVLKHWVHIWSAYAHMA